MSAILSCTGLVLDMVGILILFHYGPPFRGNFMLNENKEWIGVMPMGGTQVDRDLPKAKRRFLISQIGLGVLFLGFVFQLLGTIVR